MKMVCAWCGADMPDGPEEEAPSVKGMSGHGICPTCLAKLKTDAARAEEVYPLDELEANAERLRRRPMIGVGEDKVYTGIRRYDGCSVTVNANPLPARTDLANHSPTGFEWGYEGSGPAQLSLAILSDYLGDEQQALALYQEFKHRCTANLPHHAWTLTGSTVKVFVDACRKGVDARAGS